MEKLCILAIRNAPDGDSDETAQADLNLRRRGRRGGEGRGGKRERGTCSEVCLLTLRLICSLTLSLPNFRRHLSSAFFLF